MDELQKQAHEMLEAYDRLADMAEKSLLAAPEGTLRVSHSNRCAQYYHISENADTNGRYIRKSEAKLLQELAQKEYVTKLLPVIRNNQGALRHMLERYLPESAAEIYENLSHERRRLVQPLVLTDEGYLKAWEEAGRIEKQSCKRQFAEPETDIFTEKGEKVRSKSEKILADKFQIMGIPYIYEKPISLKSYGYVRPDFTLLNVKTRREYYWEHLGMMDNQEYCENAIKKIETYERNGIFPGEKLLLTYESGNHILNMRAAEELIKKHLL